MCDIAEEVKESGSELVLIGTGSPEQGREFARRTGNPFRVLVDPDLVGYRAAELKRKLYGGIRRQTLPRIVSVFRKGFRGHGIQGDAHQLGGVFVVKPGNELAYSYISKTFDDRGDVRMILGALGALSPEPAV